MIYTVEVLKDADIGAGRWVKQGEILKVQDESDTRWFIVDEGIYIFKYRVRIIDVFTHP